MLCHLSSSSSVEQPWGSLLASPVVFHISRFSTVPVHQGSKCGSLKTNDFFFYYSAEFFFSLRKSLDPGYRFPYSVLVWILIRIKRIRIRKTFYFYTGILFLVSGTETSFGVSERDLIGLRCDLLLQKLFHIRVWHTKILLSGWV